MKVSELIKRLQEHMDETHDPEVDIVLERAVNGRIPSRVQHEDKLKDVAFSRRWICGKEDIKSTRIKLIGESFEN